MDRIEQLTKTWNAERARAFENRLRQGETPEEALRNATADTQKKYARRDPRGEWQSDLECYTPWPPNDEDDTY